jgi:hypothetical protein
MKLNKTAAFLFRAVILSSVLQAAFLPQAIAQSVHITVDAAAPGRTIENDLFGINTAAWDSDYRSQEVIDLLKTTSISSFRYPGGSWADTFDWTKPRFTGMPMTKDLGTLVDTLRADGVITFNYGSGSPQMAAAWAAYCLSAPSSKIPIGFDSKGVNWKTSGYWAKLRAAAPLKVDDGLNPLRAYHPQPFHITRFEAGNECYGSWENDTHAQKHDPVLYAQFVAQTYGMVKSIDHNVSIGVVVTDSEDGNCQESVVNPRTKAAHSGWTPVVLSTLYGLKTTPDFVIYHSYPEQPGVEDDGYLLQCSREWRAHAKSIRTMLSDYLRFRGSKIQIICTESNSVTFSPGKQTTSLVNGLYLADSFGALLSTEFRGLYWWTLHNSITMGNNENPKLYGWRSYGDYGVLAAGAPQQQTPKDAPYPTFHALQLISKFCRPGDSTALAVSDDGLVSAYAVKRRNRNLTLLLINKSPAQAKSLQISLHGYIPRPTGISYSYGMDQDTASAHGLPSGLLQEQKTNISQSFTETLKPYSMAVLVLMPK